MSSGTARRARELWLLMLVLAAACSGSNDVTSNQVTGVAVAVTPATLTVAAGASDTVTVTVTSSGGFAGSVSVSASGAPPGVTVGSVTIPAGQTTGKLPVAVASGTATGTSTITVTASGTGIAAQTTSFTLTVTAGAGFSMALRPSILPLQAGSSAVDTITVMRTGGFSGAVALTVTGAPAKLTATLDSSSVGGTRALLHLVADSTLAAGSYPLVVHGSATDMTAQTDTLTVQVTTPVPPSGDFTLTLLPVSLSIQAGAAAVDTVTVARTGSFAGAVALSVTGAPGGMTATLDSASLGGTRTLLHLSASSSLAAGSYTLSVHGNATGLTQKTASLAVQVNAASSSGNISWTFCGISPIWVAVQDGSGPWTEITPTNTVYRFNMTSAKGGLAFVTGSDTAGYMLHVTYASEQEFAAAGGLHCPLLPGGKTVNGSVVGLSTTEDAYVSLGATATFVTGSLGNTFTLTNVPVGTVDLLASRLTASLTGTFTVNKLYLQRGLNPADGSTLAPIDFGSAQAFDPVIDTVTIANRMSDNVFANTLFLTAGGSSLEYGDVAHAAATDTLRFAALPPAQLQSGDLHWLQVTATPAVTSPTSTRTVGEYFHDPANHTVTLPAALSVPTPATIASSPYLRLGVTYTPQPDYDRLWGSSFSQGLGSTARVEAVSMTAAYAGAGPAVLNVPDLSGAAGWNNAWALVPGVSTNWGVYGYGWPGASAPAPPVADGSSFRLAEQNGTITP